MDDAKTNVQVQPLTCEDQEIVWNMLRYAAHETCDIRDSPLLAPYGADFGKRAGDFGVVARSISTSHAEDDDDRVESANHAAVEVMGAAWVRLLPIGCGFAHVASDIPELAIAVAPKYQGQGFGTLLLERLVQDLRLRNDVKGVSLSCRTNNVAGMRLYEKMGFGRIPGSEVTNRVGGASVSMLRLFQTDDSP